MTDRPDPSDRDELLEYMIGRSFRLEQDRTIYFEGVDKIEETDKVGNEDIPEIASDAKVNTVFLVAEIVETDKESVDGQNSETTVTTVDPAQGDKNKQFNVPFDTIRMNWLNGDLTEL